MSSVVTSAQTESASISGGVTDLTGAVIVGAGCKITDIETGVFTTTITNEERKRRKEILGPVKTNGQG
jgi:hypothetical protein